MSSFNPIIPHNISPKQVICGFTTRCGGVSLPPFDSLNLGFDTPDNPLNVRENHKIVYTYTGVEETHSALMKQVHGKNVSIVLNGGIYPATDGLVTSKCGVMLGIRIADCIPLLLFDPVHSIIGAIHCGWRSITAGIAEEAIRIMCEEMGTHPEDIMAAMGPAAGPCCYEIGEDTADHFRPSSIISCKGKLFSDIRAELQAHLLDAGLNGLNIEICSDCTICNENLYFSHRRDGLYSGRMLGYIMKKG